MDERDEDYDYAYSKAGERVYELKSGRRGTRINLMAGYRGNQLIAPVMFKGGCNRDVFEAWLEQFLLPEIKPGDVVILPTFERSFSRKSNLNILFLRRN